jgi:hypothetical protein
MGLILNVAQVLSLYPVKFAEFIGQSANFAFLSKKEKAPLSGVPLEDGFYLILRLSR